MWASPREKLTGFPSASNNAFFTPELGTKYHRGKLTRFIPASHALGSGASGGGQAEKFQSRKLLYNCTLLRSVRLTAGQKSALRVPPQFSTRGRPFVAVSSLRRDSIKWELGSRWSEGSSRYCQLPHPC